MKSAMKKIAKKVAMRVAMKKAMKKAMKSKVAKGKLMMNRRGKVVSKAASAAARKRCSHLLAWGKAVAAARKQLDIKGFVAVGGKSAAGKALYAKAKSLCKA